VPAHVLVVDDEAAVRESLVAQLGHMGVQVDSAASPGEATRLLGHSGYDAVLMDLRMPGQSGLEVHRALAESNPVLAHKVVFMTGDLVNDDLIRAAKSTGNPLLEKPFTADELRAALHHAQSA
jgi:CheY-like chemotaxis protein